SSDKADISLRVITDHIRSSTFMIGDGVMPSNEGRGYVLRRILRRAARHGKLLGVGRTFLAEVCETVIKENQFAYPELAEKKETITKIVNFEEESFYKTIDQGLGILNNFIAKADSDVFSGDDAFKLNDTYGFPLDLTREILEEKGISVDIERFKALLFEQRERARNARKNAGADAWIGEGNALDGISATTFVGYEELNCETEILAIVKDGEKVETASEGDEVIIALKTSPFYAESGGQVGDMGTIKTVLGSADVIGTTKNANGIYIHKAVITAGTIQSSENANVAVNIIRRRSIMRNHTAAHLLQAALRQVLGNHVEQAGQLVNEAAVRFDFTHFSALSAQELSSVEILVNKQIMDAVEVTCKEMAIEDAKKEGAMALFGEKYGATVRVVTAGNISKEFCGGTHVTNAANLGLFKIISEASAAAGVRRITAVTGLAVMNLLEEYTGILKDTAQNLKANNIHELSAKSASVATELKEKDRQIETLNSKIANINLENVMRNAVDVNGVSVISAIVTGSDAKTLRVMSDRVKSVSEGKAIVCVIAGTSDGKGSIITFCSKIANEMGLKAGNIVKAVAQITGGNGGGKPDFAMAGAKDTTKLDEAISAVNKIVEEQMKG
ncbi:MAG: alanine--tRNA ligase, partial [Clostridia bacterium]